MRTVVIDAPGEIRVDTRPDPSLPGTGGAIIAVTTTAICGSDLHFYEGDYPLPVPVARMTKNACKPPPGSLRTSLK